MLVTEALTLEFWWMAYGTLLLFGEKQSITVYVCVGGGRLDCTKAVENMYSNRWSYHNHTKKLG